MIDGLRRWFFGQVAYPLAVRARREHSVFERLEKLRSLEAKSKPRLVEAAQQRALAGILSTALRVPYYSEMLSDRDWSTPALALQTLREMPPLEKASVQDERARLENQLWTGRVVRKTTGGSTGRPVTIVKNAEAVAQEMAASWLGYGWFGIRIGDPCVRFWGQPVSNIKRRFRYLAADAAMHRLTLSAFGYTQADLRKYISTIQMFRPRYLYGYVSALETWRAQRGMTAHRFRRCGP
jgi:phenylacetate-CoA ligase